MVGGLILKKALQDKNINKVISISRKTTGIKNSKLEEIIHNNFLDYTYIENIFFNIDIAYFCIGVYTGNVSKEKLYEITVDYLKTFANTVKKYSPDATFIFLSGMGADRTLKSKITFANDKGIAENYLLSENFKELYIFRPGYIYSTIPRIEPNISYKIYKFLYPLMKIIMPNNVITSEKLSYVMLHIGINKFKQDTLENKEILDYLNLHKKTYK